MGTGVTLLKSPGRGGNSNHVPERFLNSQIRSQREAGALHGVKSSPSPKLILSAPTRCQI